MILSYVWYASFQKTKNQKFRKKRDRRNLYGLNIGLIHLLTWAVSIILSIVALEVGKVNNAVEGNSLTGACFLSTKTTTVFLCFVCIPALLMLLVLIWSCFCSCVTLSGYLNTAKSLGLKSNDIRQYSFHRLRIVLFILPLGVLVIILFSASLYDVQQTDIHDLSLKMFLISKMKQSVLEKGYYIPSSTSNHSAFVTPSDRHSPIFVLLLATIQPLCNIVVSTLVFTRASLDTWKQFLIKIYEMFGNALCCNEQTKADIEMKVQTPKKDIAEKGEDAKEQIPRMKKLQLIAQAWEKRYDVQRTGRLSITLSDQETMKDDKKSKPAPPIVVGGLETLNRSSGHDEASEFNSMTEFHDFAAALPRLVQRRGGCAGVFELGLKPWGSVDSNLHLSRTVSIRSSKIGGFSYNSRRSSFAGSRFGNGDSQQSSYRSEFSEYLYGLHRESLRKSKTSSTAKKFIRRFSRRSVKSNDISSRDVSDQNSVVSDDNNVTILPAITIIQPSPTDAANCMSNKEDNTKLNQIKSRLQDKQTKIPAPGNSINLTPLATSKIQNYTQVNARLKDLDSRNLLSSKETYLSEDESCCDKNKRPSSSVNSYEQVAVQTSLTDLSALGMYNIRYT